MNTLIHKKIEFCFIVERKLLGFPQETYAFLFNFISNYGLKDISRVNNKKQFNLKKYIRLFKSH